ncbi:serine hydrolase domain-containing protein [Streptomyces huiliensis]|uniref:serine hydrolase domain-containing protein n=1 Tax=Streptomyces huiliensis TaxID=2876027 RepID=UPI001CBE334A|nr:serine hydrolase domain-containing protein [Streptomyces huiliensis]MBZ4323391.1 beta-lactamase family protein [Streptomyces huiliensis]
MTDAIVQGTVAEGFEPVREVFAATLAEERAGHAAQLAAYVHGRRVVDLWGGPEIDGDSLTGVFSSTKGAAHLVVALLVQDGTLDLDREVRHYWPEFAAGGKEHVTLRQLISHQAGLVGADGGFTPEEMADDRAIAERLGAQRPYWRPGAAFGYHALVIGALTGEVVRRVTGQTMQEVYETRIRAPYGIDLFMGLPEELEPRWLSTQPMDPTPEQKRQRAAAGHGPDGLPGVAFNRNHAKAPTVLEEMPNARSMRAAGPASVGGVASARGLARLYAAAVSGVDGRDPLLTADMAARVAEIQAAGRDLVNGAYQAYGLGFVVVSEHYPFLGARSFGHSGAAGSLGFADPGAGLAFGYNRRRFAFPGGAAPETFALAKVIRECAAG